jgi:hypothetical protein
MYTKLRRRRRDDICLISAKIGQIIASIPRKPNLFYIYANIQCLFSNAVNRIKKIEMNACKKNKIVLELVKNICLKHL